MMTRANGSDNPDASDPIRERAWYMCARSWNDCNKLYLSTKLTDPMKM